MSTVANMTLNVCSSLASSSIQPVCGERGGVAGRAEFYINVAGGNPVMLVVTARTRNATYL